MLSDEKLWIATLWLLLIVSPLCSGWIARLPPRQVDGNQEMDFSSFPACSSGECISKFTSLGCGDFITRDCFCGKPNPLSCAWPLSWQCWNITEDWFAAACPSVTPVNLTSLPSCARDCFMAAFNYSCYENTKNCLCTISKPDCDVGCQNNRGAYDTWYASQCQYNLTDVSSSGVSTSRTSSSTAPPSTITLSPAGTTTANSATATVDTRPQTVISTGTIVGSSIGGFVASISIGLGIYFCWVKNSRSKKISQGVNHRSIGVDIGVDSGEKPRYELDSRGVQRPTDGRGGGAAGSKFSEGVWEMDPTPAHRN